MRDHHWTVRGLIVCVALGVVSGTWVQDEKRQEPRAVTPGSQGAPPSDAIVLFDGKDLSKWTGRGGVAKWEVKDGAAIVNGSGDIVTKQKFGDMQLHIEWATPADVKGSSQGRGNSGVYLQRRYEIQILDSIGDQPPKTGGCGSIYRQRPPDHNMSRKPGKWQVYDITFRAARFDASGKKTVNARITIVWNGETVHDDVELSAKTGAGKPEGAAPGPIMLQDHGAPVRFRNIWIAPEE